MLSVKEFRKKYPGSIRREVWVALSLIAEVSRGAGGHGSKHLWFGPWGRRTFEEWKC